MKCLFKILSFLFILMMVGFHADAQETIGEVSYINNQHVYVRFDRTTHININDTLFQNLSPCLKVIKKSSSSCVCNKLKDCNLNQGSKLLHIKREPIFKNETEIATEPEHIAFDPIEVDSSLTSIQDKELEEKRTQKVRGRFSLASYSNMSDDENEDDRHRIMGRFSYNIYNIGGSRYSLESYVNYRQNFISGDIPTDYQTRFTRIYNLALNVELDEKNFISVGRKINRNVSSIGVIDGLQYERQFGYFYGGAIIGFRPDHIEFDLNPNLFQYGVYYGYEKSSDKITTQNTIGFIEQKNTGNTDRRYLYFQSVTSLSRKLNIFNSLETDIFSKINDIVSTNARLTNLLLSLRYRPSNKVSFTLAYDNRRRIIFYETLKTDIERLLDDDDPRQGIRTRVSIKPLSGISIGFSYSKRFQNDETDESNNYNYSLLINKIPIIKGSLSIRSNVNQSSFIESKIYAFNYSNSILKKKVFIQLYYRLVQFEYLSNENKNQQKFLGTSMYFRISKKFRLGVLGELIQRKNENQYRFNTRLNYSI